MAQLPIWRLLDIMARLRDPDLGGPWDREQNFRSIAVYTIEEAYEVADAVEREDMPDLMDELGDLLFQVVFHARMAEECGQFDFDDVVVAICKKMVRRHPHVFGDAVVSDAVQQTAAWEEIKARERARKAGGGPAGALDGVPTAMPSNARALKLQRRASRVGFDWPSASHVLAKVREEIDELAAEMTSDSSPERLEDEVGDLLFSVVNLARHLDIEPEAATRRSNRKFEARFRAMEAIARDSGMELEQLDPGQLEELWVAAKAAVGPVE